VLGVGHSSTLTSVSNLDTLSENFTVVSDTTAASATIGDEILDSVAMVGNL
jgi:hypothetical protein